MPKFEVVSEYTPSGDQPEAIEALSSGIEMGLDEQTLLGVTGSGKTEVYLRAIEEVLAAGRNAVVLVPEISLTPQTVARFRGRFGDAVAVMHSRMSDGERFDQWDFIRSGAARVVVGARSALFTPLANVGLVVIDEEHEGSYKQDSAPRYHARDVAKFLCTQQNAVLVLGSATPSVESTFQAQRGVYQKLILRSRYNRQPLPRVVIADMREEVRAGSAGVISGPLRRELEENLTRGEQSILFLNRRGSSRMLLCGECGERPECPRCSVPLTYHSANGRLMCHYCGHSQPLPERCPDLREHFVGELEDTSWEEVEARRSRRFELEADREALEGTVYPTRLDPIPEKRKRKWVVSLNYLRYYSVWSLLMMFFMLSFMGWVWEVSLHLITDGVLVNRGVMHGPWLPIYGCGSVLMLLFLNRFRRNPALEFILIVVLCGSVEYFTSLVLEIVHGGTRWWDYTGYFLNLHGRICAEGLLVFGIGGMAIVYVLAPFLDGMFRRLPVKALMAAGLILTGIFAADQIYSSIHPNEGEGITSYEAFPASKEVEPW